MRGIALLLTCLALSAPRAEACTISASEYPQTFQLKYSYANGTPVPGLRVLVEWSEGYEKAEREWKERNRALRIAGKEEEPYSSIRPFRVVVTDHEGIADIVDLPVGHFTIRPEYGMTRPHYVKTVPGLERRKWPADAPGFTWPENEPLSTQRLLVTLTENTRRDSVFTYSSYGTTTLYRWSLVHPLGGGGLSAGQFEPQRGFTIDSAPQNKILILRFERDYGSIYGWELIGDVPVIVNRDSGVAALHLDLDFSAGSMCGPNLIPRNCDIGRITPLQLGRVRGRLRKEDGSGVWPMLDLHLIDRKSGERIATSRAMRGEFQFDGVAPGEYNLLAGDGVGVTYAVPVDVRANVPVEFGLEIELPPPDVCRDPVVQAYRF